MDKTNLAYFLGGAALTAGLILLGKGRKKEEEEGSKIQMDF
jgi:LPXTG-motif cell wall-anchored protein